MAKSPAGALAGRQLVRIGPGEHHVTDRDAVITTVLGSCISACLYDPVRRVMGMNHFLLANRRYARNLPICASEAGRYGVHAMELVINGMLELGARKESMRAKVFGGAAVLNASREPDGFLCVPDVNCRFILAFLRAERIPLVASRLGGNHGRVIHFSFGDYAVYVRRTESPASRQVVRQERAHWERAVRQQEAPPPKPDLWK